MSNYKLWSCPDIQNDYNEFVFEIIKNLKKEQFNIDSKLNIDLYLEDKIVISHNYESYYKNIDKNNPKLLEKNQSIMVLNFWNNYFYFFDYQFVHSIIEYKKLLINDILKAINVLKKLCLKDVEKVLNYIEKSDNVLIEHLENIKKLLCENLENKFKNIHIGEINSILSKFLKKSGHKLIIRTF